jgi:hypothetical protein
MMKLKLDRICTVPSRTKSISNWWLQKIEHFYLLPDSINYVCSSLPSVLPSCPCLFSWLPDVRFLEAAVGRIPILLLRFTSNHNGPTFHRSGEKARSLVRFSVFLTFCRQDATKKRNQTRPHVCPRIHSKACNLRSTRAPSLLLPLLS